MATVESIDAKKVITVRATAFDAAVAEGGDGDEAPKPPEVTEAGGEYAAGEMLALLLRRAALASRSSELELPRLALRPRSPSSDVPLRTTPGRT